MLLTEEDLRLFAEASGDHNPLHAPTRGARRSPFGRHLAHGMLVVLAMVEESSETRHGIGALTADFRRPVHPGVEYELTRTADRLSVADAEGERTIVTVRPGSPRRGGVVPAAPRTVRPARRSLDEIVEGAVSGTYGPDGDRLRLLMRRWPVSSHRLGALHLACLTWCSQMTGMDLPGEHGLLCRVGLTFHSAPESVSSPLRYTGDVVVDRRLGLVVLTARLYAEERPVAEVEIESLVLSPAPLPDSRRLAELLPPSRRLADTTSVVVGGGRGLGAGIVLALHSQGSRVFVGHRGTADELRELGVEDDGVTSISGDAGTLDWARRLPAAPDILVCSAAPPLRPVGFTVDSGVAARYVADAVRLVWTPLAAMLDRLGGRRARCVIVSSDAVRSNPFDWPHYVAAKSAIEGLVRWAAHHHPTVEFFLTRPGALRTDQMNTPGARLTAAPVEPVAAAVVRRLCDATPPAGNPELLDNDQIPKQE
ncbi:NAD(P)-dependent dehydrogenase (short-subunit alcohol dehydrogenase family)/acyl dehydratase [Actinoalloteichus hoggarensis]|uniref:Short chain dehydrogenase n=1 Tax=Actinoalloteichus hoggarensis TaxID=1470176 RepID=A0A221W567_9PSEU|nr:MaoC/PaaZ C-terminal domain-containing protein [Actinoalloteichus hoggarensis]ASO20689.1 short chain dehydrogenase [Actinoalloteichus hoggarensis]MBB5924458.1 NAD(P)-dependent dehydrogenase (short-subunit alcohol dehydrogenase family)/acyl dehydratase [Actinoalloteichus hoggarensis]